MQKRARQEAGTREEIVRLLDIAIAEHVLPGDEHLVHDEDGVVLVNAVKEQQAQIEAQQQQIELLKQKDATNQMEIMMFGT